MVKVVDVVLCALKLTVVVVFVWLFLVFIAHVVSLFSRCCYSVIVCVLYIHMLISCMVCVCCLGCVVWPVFSCMVPLFSGRSSVFLLYII